MTKAQLKKELNRRYGLTDGDYELVRNERGYSGEFELIMPSHLEYLLNTKPVKTLKWLEDQTGLEWKFYGSTLCQGAMLVYDVHTQLLFSHEGKALITNWSSGEYIEVTPQEFIEKITRGEWI